MKERVQEQMAAAHSGPRTDKADEESAVLTKIAERPPVGLLSCVGSHGGHARTTTTIRTNPVVHVLQRAIVAVVIGMGIVWTAAALVYLGGLVVILGGLVP